MTTTNNTNTQQYITQTNQTNPTPPPGWTIPVRFVNPLDREGRVPYASRKEYEIEVVLGNWGRSNQELGAFLGVTTGSVSRLRKLCKEKSQFLDMCFNDYIRLRNDPGIRVEVKFVQAAKMICLLSESTTNVQGSNVRIEIHDVAPSPKE
jgi:hypothetical protein